MHEASLMKNLIGKIESISCENGHRRIINVQVTLGALCHISTEHFRDHFQRAVSGTVAEGALLETEELADIHDPQAQDIVLKHVEMAPE